VRNEPGVRRGDRRRGRGNRGIEVAIVRHAIDQAPVQRRGGIDGRRGQDQPARAAPADEARQQRRMNHRGDADLDLGHGELRILRGDAQVAGRRHLEPAAEAPAFQPRDHRNRKLSDRLAQVAQAGDEGFGRGLVERRHLPDVGAADEAPLARSAQHQHAEALVRRKPIQAVANALDHRGVHDIERAGIADRELRDAVAVRHRAVAVEGFHRRALEVDGTAMVRDRAASVKRRAWLPIRRKNSPRGSPDRL